MSLQGIRILNPRAAGLSKELNNELTTAGATVIEAPAMCICPSEKSWLTTLPPTLSLAIFISRNAVHYAMPALIKAGIRCDSIAAIGPATKKALHEFHVSSVICPAHDSNSEALLSLLPTTLSEPIGLFRGGADGRRLLSDTLAKTSARVIECAVYERLCPNNAHWSASFQSKPIDIILGTSAALIHNVFTLCDPQTALRLRQLPWLLMSERLVDIIKRYGVNDYHLVTQNNIFKSLVDWAKQHKGR